MAAALVAAGGDVRQVKAIGVTNQRETTVAWDSTTGKPLHPAIVWLDDRTKEVVAMLKESFGSRPGLREKCGLPISTYFSATKVKEAFLQLLLGGPVSPKPYASLPSLKQRFKNDTR